MGMSLIFISHNLAVVQHISHRVMVLYLGKMMEIADRNSLYMTTRCTPTPRRSTRRCRCPIPTMERSKARIVLKGDLPSPLNPPSGCPFRTRCRARPEICAQVMPELVAAGRDHMVACHHASAI